LHQHQKERLRSVSRYRLPPTHGPV
jgi:hypothetical protein